MREETRIDIKAAENIEKYDRATKAVWRNKEILAPLLKYAVEELSDKSVSEIIRYIDADTIEEDIPVSDIPPQVIDRGTEQSSLTDRIITYDLHFKVKNPVLSSKDLLVMLHIDLEFNNIYRPVLKDGRSYPLSKRGIYYAAREISSQLGRITEKTNYDDIEKVISIWVVNDEIPKALRNTATRYYIEKQDFIGEVRENKADYDLMEVVIIRRGDDKNITEPIFEYLEAVYKSNEDSIQKYIPEEDYIEVEKEVHSMPGMGIVIYEQGIERGIGQGIERGTINTTIGFVRDGDITPERAAEKLNITVDEVHRYLREMETEESIKTAGAL